MSFKVIGPHLSPAEGEAVVRTYHCTNLSPVFALIGLKTDGYLSVTNKRVVYFAEGSSLYGVAGSSRLYNEVPISDVANISLSKGTRFSFLRLLCGLCLGTIFSLAVAACVAAALFGVIILLKASMGGGDPYFLRFTVFLDLAVASVLVSRSASAPRGSLARLMLVACGLTLVLLALWLPLLLGLPSLPHIYLVDVVLVAIPLACYWLWCLYWFVRREYLTMTIASKSGMSNPIRIVGVSWWGTRNVAADLASGVGPGTDADAVFRELGAMVSDIQTMGDHGIQKWLQGENDPGKEDANTKPAAVGWYRHSARNVMAAIVIIGAFVGIESMWYASGAQQALALKMRNEVAAAKDIVDNDKSIREWAPKSSAAADQEAAAGEAAFVARKFTNATAHWKLALATYTGMPKTAVAMRSAATVQAKYNEATGSAYVQETSSERLKTGFLSTEFVALMDQHPLPNDQWGVAKQSADEARKLADEEMWRQAGSAWGTAQASLFQAVRLMRADVCVKLAEEEIKKGNAKQAIARVAKAMKELPGYEPAAQRGQLANRMVEYAAWLTDMNAEVPPAADNQTDITKQLDQAGSADWTAVKAIVDSARAFANQNEWAKCNDEWMKALDKIPAVVHAVLLERLESESRRGNWDTVSILATRCLQRFPDDVRAKELEEEAESAKTALHGELSYQEKIAEALKLEMANGHIKAGDMTDFITHMDKYGKEEWAQVKDAVRKAEVLMSAEQGDESSKEWTRAYEQFPAAVQRMLAETWMDQAEMHANGPSPAWAKVLVCAEKALKEKPDHVRAKELRDLADEMEMKRLKQAK
jgi:hypothetical protein